MAGRLSVDVVHYAIDEEERSSYYGGASVPFTWESRPGTPKHNLYSNSSLPPPLTPPPSYYSSTTGICSTLKSQSKVKSKLTQLFSKFIDLRKSSHSSKKTTTNNVCGSSFSWSSTSSSSSFTSSPPRSLKKPAGRVKRLSKHKEDNVLRLSPTSTLCYSNGGKKGFMKRALFSGPLHGSTGKALI